MLSRKEMELRRLAAAHDLEQGVPKTRIAELYGVTRTTVFRWFHKMDSKGVDGLKRTIASGRPRQLTSEQLEAAMKFYNGKKKYRQVADFILEEFGIAFSTDHVGRMLGRHAK